MARITLTRDIAWAASADAGDRSMRAAGRTAWNDDDWNASAAEFDRLWPVWRDLGITEAQYATAMAA